MKNNKCTVYLKSTAFILVSILFFGCCKDDSCISGVCQTDVNKETKNINGFVLDPNNSFYNQAVATFKLAQENKRYTAPNTCTVCPLGSSSNSLRITNNTIKTLQFDYRITYRLNLAFWEYNNVAQIPPNGTEDIGEINTNPASLSLGNITIQCFNFSYR